MSTPIVLSYWDTKKKLGIPGRMPSRLSVEHGLITKDIKKQHEARTAFLNKQKTPQKSTLTRKEQRALDKIKEEEDEQSEADLQKEMVEELKKGPNVKKMVKDIENKGKEVKKSMKATVKADKQVEKINKQVEKEVEKQIIKRDGKPAALTETNKINLNKKRENAMRKSITQLLKQTPTEIETTMSNLNEVGVEFFKKFPKQLVRIQNAIQSPPETFVNKPSFDPSNIDKVFDRFQDGALSQISTDTLKTTINNLYLKGKLTDEKFEELNDKIKIKSNREDSINQDKIFVKLKPKIHIPLIRKTI